ncbi:MAG TPA: amino acid ABC transporter permease [Aestuariivirgaceae bacterium]|nr:amino acid ABC transporter permease [Aestuariivirgaceae bacterium]
MTLDLAPLLTSWRFLASGLVITLLVSGLSLALGVVIGLLVGIGRTYGGWILDVALGFYVDSVRAIPVLVILVWAFFALPLLTDATLSPIVAGVIGLGVHAGAYVSEVIRAGLTSVRERQFHAGLALGMSRFQVIRTIILPQALVRMLPPLGSLVVLTIKDSAIASVIAVPELIRQSQTLVGQSFRPFEIYTAVMIVYFLVLYPLARGVDAVYRRVAHLGAS